jgi:hypothetical protein
VPKIKGDTYTFDIADIAQAWVGDANVGVALVNDPDNTSTPFQTVFSVKSIKATMTYTPPVAAAPPPPATTPGLGGSGLGNGAGTTSGSTGSAPAPQGPVNLPPSGTTTTTTTPSTGETPDVAPTTPSTTPAAAIGKTASSMPSGAFWLGAIAIALLVVVAGAVLADDKVPAAAATTSRLGRVLRDRQRALQLETPDTSTDPTATLALRKV